MKKHCPQGHQFDKTSDCESCPICEAGRKPKSGWLSQLSAPARRALESKTIITLAQLTFYTEAEIVALHGMGPKAMEILKKELKGNKLAFKKK